MNFDLRLRLPHLLPKAIAWAEALEQEILRDGVPLDKLSEQKARLVGVLSIDRIRIAEVPRLPLPNDPELRMAALQTGLLGPNMVGLTLGYGIYICRGHAKIRLLAHECRHVYQYEQAGSIAAFLPVYLNQIVEYGYDRAPFEIDARALEAV
ncbi:MAG: hypothetical protein ACRDHZ_15260 [Ktedonobacteraceae bacterium]